MKNKKKMINFFSKLIVIISLIVFIIFSVLIIKLDMIPYKYLLIFFGIFILLYSIFYILLWKKNIKNKIKIVLILILVLFSSLFCFAIRYFDTTIDFINQIDSKKHQSEEYEIATLSTSLITKLEELENKKIGVYYSNSTKNTEIAVKELKQDLKFIEKKYKNVVEMLEDLQDGILDAVVVNGSIKNILSTGELDFLDIKLKKIHSISIKVETLDIAKIVDVTSTPFNIYIAGGDAYGTIDKVMNTDVNMVVTVDPSNNKILLTSIPRDYYVNLDGLGTNAYDKLTHAGYYGIETSVNSVQKLLDIEINYYVKVNFSTIEQVIDAMGGVSVHSDYAFVTQNNDYIRVGYNDLDGATALDFARERKSFVDGDVQRVKNQQKVLSAIINKFTSSETLIKRYPNILSSVSNSFATNLDKKSISRLVKKQLNDMKGWSIESQNLTGYDLYTPNTYTFPGTELYVMERNEESLTQAKNKINEFLKND